MGHIENRTIPGPGSDGPDRGDVCQVTRGNDRAGNIGQVDDSINRRVNHSQGRLEGI